MNERRYLFELFPGLRKALPWVRLADLPTPVEELPELAAELGAGRLLVKRDDLSGRVYGGNKIRKLEFLLGEALQKGATAVMTFGCAGSNHATATAIYARQLGLKSVSMLLPQPNAHSVQRNLLLSYRHGAELHFYDTSRAVAIGVEEQTGKLRAETGREPEIIPAGGSSPLGAVGYVNAALELEAQITAGLPRPDVIYVAGGTTGTAAGLMVGLKAIGLNIPVVIVRVTAEKFVNMARILELLEQTGRLLHDSDASFPSVPFAENEICLRHEFFGEEYALYTPESVEAVRLAKERAGAKLEGTYTGKTFAALMADARAGRLRDKTVLFWNTYNSMDFSETIARVDYHDLPEACHWYFEEDVQPLDRHL